MKFQQMIEILEFYGNDQFVRACKAGDLKLMSRLAAELHIPRKGQTNTALCVQIARRLLQNMLGTDDWTNLEPFHSSISKRKREETYDEVDEENDTRNRKVNISNNRYREYGNDAPSQKDNNTMNQSEALRKTKMTVDVDIKDCPDDAGQNVIQLSYLRSPTYDVFPRWAIVKINNKCVNAFDVLYAIKKAKIQDHPYVDKDFSVAYRTYIKSHVNAKEMSRFNKYITSIPETAYQLENFLIRIGIKKFVSKPANLLPQVKINPSTDTSFRFKSDFLKIYHSIPTQKTSSTHVPVTKEHLLSHNIQKHLSACIRFVSTLTNSTSKFSTSIFSIVQNLRTSSHLSDDGEQQLDVHGVTISNCRKMTAWGDPCSIIKIKSGLVVPEFRRVAVHELIHAELHERREHPLVPKTQRKLATDHRFEEGICVLAEFLSAGLGFNAEQKNFIRTNITDDYHERLTCMKYMDEAGNTTLLRSALNDHTIKYCSGFAIALNSMVSNEMTFAELLEFYLKNGSFPPIIKPT